MNVCVLTFFGFFGPPEKLISLGVLVDGGPLVKEQIGYFNEFLCLEFFWVFLVFGNQSTVHNV